jgi:fengycin family lipopeptide synthetase D
VEKTPDRIALVGRGALTYRQLNTDANRTADYLSHEKGINPGDTVGILMSQSLYRPIAILGALEAGAGYVPMDPSLPHDRLKCMIKDACTGTIISEKQYIKDLNRLQWECRDFHSYLCMDSYDVHGEEEAERNELMNEDLWLHVGETAVDDITGGGWVSSYTGEPLSRKEMDEYGDNVLKKLEPLLHKEMRVLEIGAASGITMFRLAPKVGLYYGTDLSQVIIDKNKERVRQQDHQNIKLSCLPAHEIDKIEENNFHLIIINSVIQCFHGHNYLRKVFKKSIDLLGEKGYLFIGDIMDQEKKDAMVKELTAFKKANRTKNYTTKTDFSSELFVARGFWRDLAEESPEIETVEFSDKIYAITNELTEFRYDTLMTITRQPSGNKSKHNSREREKYQDDLSTLTAMVPGSFHLSIPIPSTGPAYIIYTSGTAGIPKGVMITHRSLVNLCQWHNRNFTVTGFDNATLYAGFGFDASVWELFPYLIKGSAIHIIEDSIRLDIDKLQEYYRRHHITIAFLPTQFCRHFLQQAAGLPALRVLLTGGDKLHADEHIAAKRNYHLYNNYGPTENTVVTTSYRIENLVDNIPIGSPIDNTCVYILDKESLQPRPVGVPGELCIAGDGLAPGYLNNPELTAEKFCLRRPGGTLPHSPHLPHSPIYLTGDLARWLPDGTIEFQGRIDQQVKVRGFRIELGEIETCLLKHEAIKEAVVIQREDEEADRYLCAYICIGGIAPIDAAELESELKEYLAQSLPAYMIPAYFVPLDKIPLTANGKIDRKKLPEPGLTVGERRAYKAPATETEKRLVELWSEVLGIGKEKIGVNDDFFQLGGHSLKATVLTAKIHKVFDIKMPLLEIFKTPTIEHLARYIRDAKPELYISVKAVEKREYYPVSSAQKRLYVLHQMEGGNMAYNMPNAAILEGDLDQEKLEKVFRQFIHRHETLRTSFHMVNEEVVQVVHEKNYKIQITKYKQIPNHKLQNTNTAPFIRPFDLSKAPLIRIGLTALARDRHVFMMDLHHIVSDGVSRGLSFQEFMALYNDEKLPPLRIQYKDYAVWQQSEEERKRIAKQQEYWLTEFAGEIPVLNLPLDFARPTVQRFDGKQVSTQLDAALTGGIKQMASANDATLFMVILSLYIVLLSKLSGQEDIPCRFAAYHRHVCQHPCPSEPAVRRKKIHRFFKAAKGTNIDGFREPGMPI